MLMRSGDVRSGEVFRMGWVRGDIAMMMEEVWIYRVIGEGLRRYI